MPSLSNINDIMAGNGLSYFQLSGNADSDNDVAGGPCWVKKVIIHGGAADAQLDLFDAATAGSVNTGDLVFGATTNDTFTVEFPGSGYYFSTGLSGLHTGPADTGFKSDIWYRVP